MISILTVEEKQPQELLFIWYSITRVARYGEHLFVCPIQNKVWNLIAIVCCCFNETLCMGNMYKMSYLFFCVVQ